MNKFLLFLLTTAIATSAWAQENPPGNLVPNPYFKTAKKVKGPGGIANATDWYSATSDEADLYSTKAKPPYTTEMNAYGGASPEEEDGVAGLLMYSYKDKARRTYIGTKLKSALNEGELYCVKFYVSMADLSKYACNGIGAHLSVEKPTPSDIMKDKVQAQVSHSQNRVFQETAQFEPICQVYEAQGGEEYLTIGSFMPQADISALKVKRPSGFNKPQVYMGYYYIDAVTVSSMDSIDASACLCEKAPGGSGKMNIVYRSNVSAEAELNIEKQVSVATVFFDLGSTELNASANEEVAKMVKLMKDNPDVRIEVKGHVDKMELAQAGGEAGETRSVAVYTALVAGGIDAARLEHKDFGTSAPATQDASPQARARNRRVDFRLLK